MTTNPAPEKERLIQRIIDREEEMFRAVRTREKSPCQDRPETFRLMRWMSHTVLSRETLTSYLSDLDEARRQGRNLMTEKYARMENLIPPRHNSPRIPEIADAELEWMSDLKRRYPHIVRGESAAFLRYLRSEYETYSERTLERLGADIEAAREQGINLAERRYRNLFLKLGYASLEDVEKKYRVESFGAKNRNAG